MPSPLSAAAPVPVLSVSDLTQRLRASLELDFGEVWVGGEISNFRAHGSGHFYFRLKDRRSQIAAVMFRSANQTLPFLPRDGLDVIVRGRVSVYEMRGDLQLYVDAMEPRGIGGLQLALRQLKERLTAEGLFAESRKRPLPFWPAAVGVITALGGAAIHDVVATARQRMPSMRLIVRAVRVQGVGAGAEVVAALGDLNGLPEIEVIVVGRGGGSAEDLWVFNEERVARAVAGSRVPVVSAVGHEIDTTLADLAADRRAATPTAAAMLVVPDRRDLTARVDRAAAAMAGALRMDLRRRREQLAALGRQLRDPRQTLEAQRRRVDELAERNGRAAAACVRLARERLRGAGERLQALSPLAVLERGYAIARREADGRVVRAAHEVVPGDRLAVTFRQGTARVRVEETS